MVQALDDYDVQQDLPQALHLLDEMSNNVKQVADLVENMLQKVKNGELSTEHGLSFLEIKYHMLLNYLINLTYVVLRKCSGHTIERDPAIDRLIEIRTVLEKIRPIDYKLRYQIDKLVKTAVTGGTNSNDLTTFKANPNNLTSQLPENEINSSDEETDDDDDDNVNDDSVIETKNKTKKSTKDKLKTKSNIYVPPKLSAVHYDGDETREERTRKQMERARKLALNSSIIQDLKDEYLDTPIEITSTSRAQQIFSKAQKEKEEYEEQYLTRLPITKADKHRQRNLTTLGKLGSEITSFGDISALEGDISTTMKKKTTSKRKKKISSKKRGNKKRRYN